MEIAFCRDHIWVHYLKRSKWIFILAVVQVDTRECSKKSRIWFELDSRFLMEIKDRDIFLPLVTMWNMRDIWRSGTRTQCLKMQTWRQEQPWHSSYLAKSWWQRIHPLLGWCFNSHFFSLTFNKPCRQWWGACIILELSSAIWVCTRAF